MRDMAQEVRRRVALRDDEAMGMALWILHTYCYDLARHSPFLALQSPTPRCGKTTALALLKGLTPRARILGQTTAAGFYRTAHFEGATLLLDEVHLLIKASRDFRAIMDAAHTKETSVVSRSIDGVPYRFETFGPKALASIGRLPDTLQDRSIVIPLRRRHFEETVYPLPPDYDNWCLPLRRKAARWFIDERSRIERRLATVRIPRELNDRAGDNWRLLLAIAAVLGSVWKRRAERAAIVLSCASDLDANGNMAEQMIRSLARLYRGDRSLFTSPPAAVHDRLMQSDDGAWQACENNRSLTQAQMGRWLAAFGVRSRVVRTKNGPVRVYERAALEDAFARYGTRPEEEST